MLVDGRGSEVLGLPECRRLLALGARQHLPGHLGIPAAIPPEGSNGSMPHAPTVLPVDYQVLGLDLVIRVGEGLYSRIVGTLVAFEVDGVEEGRAWSVLARGLAHPVEPGVLAHPPVPRVAEPGRRLVVIRTDVVSGRRLVGVRPATTDLAS